MSESRSTERARVGPVTAALLTPSGRAALAVVGVAGPGAVALVDTLFTPRGGRSLAARADGAIAYGTWRPTGEDVVIVRHAADRVEVHGHGGLAAPAAVLAGLEAAGAIRGRWQDWPEGGPCSREALEALPRAIGPKAAMILARQASGVMDGAIDELVRLHGGDRKAAETLANRLLAASRIGLRLTRPWRVMLTGDVNAGKSSLLNAILGHSRSLVAAAPGTTRDVIVAPAVLRGWPVDLIDAAGTRPGGEPPSAVEQAGIARAIETRQHADLLLRVVAADTESPEITQPGDREVVVRSKIDLPDARRRPGAIATSAVTGEGIDELTDAIVDRLVPEDRRDPGLLAGPVPFTSRQVADIRKFRQSVS